MDKNRPRRVNTGASSAGAEKNGRKGNVMFDKFGEFDSSDEINRAAAAQRREGDYEAILAIAEENGIDPEDAQDFIDGNVAALVTPLTAAFGKLDIEAAELEPYEIMEDWLGYIRLRCTESPEMAEAVRRWGKSLKGCIAALLTWSFKNQRPVPEDLSRSAIQTVKKEIREEEKISDLEIMMEEPEGNGGSLLDQWMEVYFREHPEKYLQIRNLYLGTDWERMAADILAPSGTAAETARIPGTGKMILAIKGSDQNPVLMNVRTMEKESYSWPECAESLRRLCPYTMEPKRAYEQHYGIAFPEKTPEELLDKKRQKEQDPPKKKENPPKPQSSPKTSVAPVQQKTEKEAGPLPLEPRQLEGIQEERQMELDEYQGVVPENCIVCHDGTEVVSPRETPREEGIRLADELAQWMRTGTVSYAGQAEGIALRLAEIIRQIVNEEHS